MMNDFSEQDRRVLEKQKQLQSLMDELMTEEMKELFKEMEKLIQEMKTDDLIVIGENFNTTRKIKATSPRVFEDDGKIGLTYTDLDGNKGILDCTDIIPDDPAERNSFLIPHIAQAFRSEGDPVPEGPDDWRAPVPGRGQPRPRLMARRSPGSDALELRARAPGHRRAFFRWTVRRTCRPCFFGRGLSVSYTHLRAHETDS